MRPPPSWLLTVVTSMLMTSSTVMGGLLPVGNGCPTPPEGCVGLTPTSDGPNKKIACDPGFVLEQDVLDAPNLLKPSPSLKAACYPKCHPKFRINKCLGGISTTDCEPASDNGGTLACQGTYYMVVNGVKVTPPLTCDNTNGWSAAGTKVVDFTTADHHIMTFCTLPPPPTISSGPTDCTTVGAIYTEDCPSGMPCTPLEYDDNLKKLKCPAGSKLMIDSKPYEYAMCDGTGGWTGHPAAPAVATPLTAFPSPTRIRASCHNYCSNEMVFAACPTGPTNCLPKPTLVNNKLSCPPDHLMTIDEKFYKTGVQCGKDGWKALPNTVLVDYNTTPYEKIRAYCRAFSSMFEIDCPKGVCEKPKYATKQLTCEKANYALVVNDLNDKPITAKKPVASTATGWKITADVSADEIVLRDYSQKIEKLKASCFSRCHIRFVDTTCTEPCNKPIYLNEGQPLFCKNADEELFLNGKQVPVVECNAATGGWREAGKPTGELLVDFNSFKEENVKAECKKGVAGPTPFPPLQNTTYSPASKLENKIGMQILIGIVVVLVFISGGLGLFLWRIQRKKRDDDEEGHSKTKTKSNSKNNSSKNKKGKKGKKNSKNTSKKGKKGKKEKEKSKKEKKEDIDSNVEVPEHQMSEANSTVPLTAALGAAGSPQNPNVMDV